MNAPGREDALTWVVLIIGIVLFLVLAYATVILWNAANPVPVVPEQKIPEGQAVETAVEHFINLYGFSNTDCLEGSVRISAGTNNLGFPTRFTDRFGTFP
jgi:flagellar basal body-associated protein FliL